MKKSIFIYLVIFLSSAFLAHAEDTNRKPAKERTHQSVITYVPSSQINQFGNSGISDVVVNDTISYEHLNPISSYRTTEPLGAIIISLLIIISIIVLFGGTLLNIWICLKILKYYKNIHQYEIIIEKIQDRINQIQEIEKNEFNRLSSTLNQNVESFKTSNQVHERYLDHTINYLFQATYSITNQITNEQIAKEILSRLFHDFQIAKLYRIPIDSNETEETDHNKFAAFAYLEENGTIDDINHLEYVSENDSNKKNRIRALEIIGRIKERSRPKL